MKTRLIGVLIALWASAGVGQAQFLDRPLTLVVPYAAGGTNDTLSRILGEHFAKTLGQPVIIENEAGAAGTLAARRVARLAPDGYTMMMGNMGTHAAAVSQYKALGYDPRSDFTPIGLTASVPAVVVTRRDFNGNTLLDLQAAMKAQPGKMSEAHIGVGSPTHTFCTQLHTLLGTEAIRVGYRGGSQAMNDLVAGHVDFSCISLSGAISQINSGSLKALAVATGKRVDVIPDVKTSAESGLPEFQVSTWNALFAPANLPPQIQDKLVGALNAALEDSSVRSRLLAIGFVLPETSERGPVALKKLVASEIPKWATVLRAGGVSPE